jgi:hypothetical protein
MEKERAELSSGGADRPDAANGASSDDRWLSIFADRYGVGAYDRLIAQLRQPCVTFAEIAATFGVTRERVRQWHLRLMPDAPKGHERQRLCGLYNQKRRLLEDPLFRSFYQHARPHFEAGRIELMKARDGYRTRSVRIDGRIVAIIEARRLAKAPREQAAPAYSLPRYRGGAEFVYFRLSAEDYLFVPAIELLAGAITFFDGHASSYRPFRNSFDAFQTAAQRRSA